jgi:hypothetical protein
MRCFAPFKSGLRVEESMAEQLNALTTWQVQTCARLLNTAATLVIEAQSD